MNVIHFAPSHSDSRRITISLHGFPAIRSKQNLEIAKRISERTGRRVDALLYSGLGRAPGVFSYSQCFQETRDYVMGLFERGEADNIDLVGHSWGGYQALRLAAELGSRVRKLVLISPLLHFRQSEKVIERYKQYMAEHPEITTLEPSDLHRDYLHVAGEASPESLISRLSEAIEVLILQAMSDEVTPAATAEKMLALFPRHPLYELVDNDHSFLRDRPQVSDRIAAFLDS